MLRIEILSFLMINNDKVNIIFLRVTVNFVAPICEDISGDIRIDECTYRRSLFLVERVDISISEISPSGRSSAFVLLSYHFRLCSFLSQEEEK